MTTHSRTEPSELPRRRLGRTDMRITRVGFGSWAVGGGDWAVGWGTQDDAGSVEAIRRALARGINWIDTAPVYGLGHSEEMVRRALEGIPAARRPYVFTKCGLTWDAHDRNAAPRQVGARASIRREVDDSLQRLGIERIDLYQMHWPAEDGTPLEEYWQTLLELKREGKVRAVGLSNHDTAQLDRAEALGHVDTLQPPFSAIRRDFAARELSWCREHDTGVIVYSPMQAGLLSGRFSEQRAAALARNDWRSRNAEFSGRRLSNNLGLAAALEPVARRHGTSVAAVAIAWTLAWPGVSGAIVGARNADQVDGWIDAARLELDPQDMAAIATAIQTTGAGSGPTTPATTPATAPATTPD